MTHSAERSETSHRPTPSPARLVAMRGKVLTRSFRLREGEKLILGRSEDADLQVLDPSLSRRHCSIERIDDNFYVSDFGSANGTLVNGKPVKERTLLKPGDIVRAGAVDFQFFCPEERRTQQADLVASLPHKTDQDIHERLVPESTNLMELAPEFQSLENYRRIARDLATIYQIGNLINSEMDHRVLLQRIVAAIGEVIPADRFFLILAKETGQLEPVAARSNRQPDGEGSSSYSRTIVQECYKSGISVLQSDIGSDEHFGAAESVILQGIRSVMCVPLESSQQIMGVIYVDTVGETEAFSQHDLELLAAVGKQAGIAIERMQLIRRTRRMFYGTVRALVATIEAKDVYTRGHSERVTNYAVRIAERMGFEADFLLSLELAGLLHDVGKIGVAEKILNKPGKLTPDEYNLIKEHPSVGSEIIHRIERSHEISRIVRHHHEHWDGSGYPDGLAGEAIPVGARMLAVADAYDAMTSQRSYRDALSRKEAMAELKRCAGSQFSEESVAQMVAILDEGDAAHTV